MTKFEILDLISSYFTSATCNELAKRTSHPNSHKRSFQAGFATRLRRLHTQGLLRRKRFRPGLIFRSRREVNHWSITDRGRARLAWAKSKGLV